MLELEIALERILALIPPPEPERLALSGTPIAASSLNGFLTRGPSRL